MRIAFTIVTVFLSLATVSAAHDVPVIRVQTQANSEGKSLEVSATQVNSAQEADRAIHWAEKDLNDAQTLNAAIRPEIIVAEPDLTGEPTVRAVQPAISKHSDGPIRRTVRALFEKHHRVTFTVVRGIANSSVVAWGLVVSSHTPLLAALPVGLVAGGMSAGFQYFNQQYQEWIMRSKTTLGRMARSFLANIKYMAITKLVSVASGIPTEPTLLLSTEAVLKTAFLGTLAQGTWNLGIAESARIATERNPERKDTIRRWNDFKTLAISMVSTAMSVANLIGAPLTDAAMYAMAGTGAAFYGWSIIKAKRWSKEKAARDALMQSCANQLTLP